MNGLQVEVNDGKYTVIIYDNGRLEARRHGESWRNPRSVFVEIVIDSANKHRNIIVFEFK